MDAAAPRDLLAHFQDLDDPRGPRVWHSMSDMLVIAMLAMIRGADRWATTCWRSRITTPNQ